MALHGLMAEFEEPGGLLNAARTVRNAGYRRFEAYSPEPVEGLEEAMELKRSKVALAVLIAALAGAATGYLLQFYALVIDYPFNTGGRPLNSWQIFIVIVFELTVLFGGIVAFCAVLVLSGLPRPHHPVFNVPEFARASRDRYFLVVEARDSRFDEDGTREFLRSLSPKEVFQVED
jgi:hypothetical protein